VSDIAIRVEDVSKRYRIGQREPYKALRDSLADVLSAPFRGLVSALNGRRAPAVEADVGPSHIWALKDVSFEVKRGEVVGIIGHNGSGKSTLLKILSRITGPTEGRVEIHGHVGSLLEVGTGFHPELTGRENVYLNGAVLGMRKVEIERKFDEIVAFAGVEKFIDTPVKYYSSGMYVRLAFAVAAHLEPEILLVDEVLAVGDAAFQQKCIGKMGAVATEGRTVFFVSHNLPSILSLCERAILFDSGKTTYHGPVREVVSRYVRSSMCGPMVNLTVADHHVAGDGSARITSVRIESASGEAAIRRAARLKITLWYRSEGPLRRPNFVVSIHDFDTRTAIFHLESVSAGLSGTLSSEGSVVCVTEPLNLIPGRCYLAVELYRGHIMADYIPSVSYFEVEPDDSDDRWSAVPRESAFCTLEHEWTVEGA
jgi:lipopolysaccharide transport system ATP-binding protein